MQIILSLEINSSFNFVYDFIQQSTRTWDEQCLTRDLGSNMVTKVLSIPLPRVACNDVSVWGTELSGQFFVCSAYRLVTSSVTTLPYDCYKPFYKKIVDDSTPNKNKTYSLMHF